MANIKTKSFNFSLIKKISISLFAIFLLFFVLIGIYTGKIIKKQILEYIKPPIRHSLINESKKVEDFFENIERIGANSVAFTKTLLAKKISQDEIDAFSKKYKLIDGAIRTDLSGFKSKDISGVFLSNTTALTDEIKTLILQTEKGLGNYAKGTKTFVLNTYFISKHNMIRIYKKKPALKFNQDHSFKTKFFKSFENIIKKEKKKPKWMPPYYDNLLKQWMTSYISPLYINNKFVGIVGHDIMLNRVYDKLLNSKLYKTGHFFIFDTDNKVYANSKSLIQNMNYKNEKEKSNSTAHISTDLSKIMNTISHNSGKNQIQFYSYTCKDGNKKLIIAKKLNFLNWYMAAVISEKEILELFPEIKFRFISSGLIFLFILLLFIILIFYILIIRPIKKLTEVSREIQRGNLGTRSNIKTKDEIGELSYAFDNMTSNLEKSLDNLNKDLIIRKQTEEALNESNEKFKKVFDNSPYMISLSRKKDSKFINVNLSFETLTGYKRHEAIGNSALGLNLWVNLDQRSDMISIIEEKGFVKDFNFLLQRKDKKIRHCLISSELIYLNKKEYLVSIIRDITEQEEAKKDKEMLEEKLEQSKKMELLGTLAGGVAHDLNNILSGLVSYPDLLLMKIPEDSSMRRPLNTIKESGKKAADIVQDLLALARRGVSTTTVVNLNNIINEYLSSLEFKKLKSYHPDFIIKTNLKNNLFNIIGSKTHITKTIMNLIANAAEAMKDGGQITITTRNIYIDKDIKKYEIIKQGNYSIIEIEDEGIGVSSIDIERIFEPFYTKKKMGKSGTGLGMSVVLGTIKDHKGFIDINSVLKKGTVFTLYFPVTNRELSRTDEEFNIKNYIGNGEKILVVDDVLEQRELAYDILTRIGYSVHIVESGEVAIDFLKKNKMDLLLLDMIMDPGIDGLDTYREVLKINPKQKTIIVSGFSETDRVSEAIRLGVSKYIKKPYSVELLSKTIKKIFNR